MAQNDIQDGRSPSLEGLNKTSDPGLVESGVYKEKDGSNLLVVGAELHSIDGKSPCSNPGGSAD